MKYISKIALTLIATVFIFSCSNEDNTLENPNVKADTESIAKLINAFDKTYKYSNEVKAKNKTIDLDKYFLSQVQTSGLDANIKTVSGSSKINSEETSYSNEYIIFINDIINTNNFVSKDGYINNLNFLNNEVTESQISNEEKQILVNKIAFMEAFVDWTETIENNNQKSSFMSKKVDDDDDCDGWWSCWGSCVAGTIGTAIGGAATGGLAPAAACTVVLPVVGTVACGTVGAIAGGVSGALTGAATFCD